MRKAMIVMLTALILILGGTCFAAVKIYDSHDQVTLTEKTSWGNKDYIEDLSMQITSTYDDRLHWSTVLPLGNTDAAVTEYDFSFLPVYEETTSYSGVEINTTISTANLLADIEEENPEGMTLAYQELADITNPGGETEKEIYLKDYIDYYSLIINLELPDTNIYRLASQLYKDVVPEQEDFAAWIISDFFKIPVLEDERYIISLRKNKNGKVSHLSVSSGEGDSFYMWTHNAITEDACYFTFDSHSAEGVVMDTSMIPGGYGIYRLPYEEERLEESENSVSVDVDGLEMVYSLAPEIDVMYLHLNQEKNRLLLHAEEYGKYVLTVIDLATMETLQKLNIMDYEKENTSQLYNEGDFIVVPVLSEKSYEAVVITENENGVYEVAFICDIRKDGIPQFDTSEVSLAFDGKRLAMSGFLKDEQRGYMNTCNVFLAVYDASGIQYYGEYDNSLDAGYDADNYYYHCRGYGARPIVLRWME